MTDIYADAAKAMRTDRKGAHARTFSLLYGRTATLKEIMHMTDAPQNLAPKKKSKRGFASMDRSTQKEIARKGGRAAHVKGTAHEFTQDEAKAAGRKGGETVARNLQHMAEIGRRGGLARGKNHRQKLKELEQRARTADPTERDYDDSAPSGLGD